MLSQFIVGKNYISFQTVLTFDRLLNWGNNNFELSSNFHQMPLHKNYLLDSVFVLYLKSKELPSHNHLKKMPVLKIILAKNIFFSSLFNPPCQHLFLALDNLQVKNY